MNTHIYTHTPILLVKLALVTLMQHSTQTRVESSWVEAGLPLGVS